jgi:hypothetical protein
VISGSTVTFTAPTGYGLQPGEAFHVNALFSGGNVSGVQFNGYVDTAQALDLPEPSSLAIAGLSAGFALAYLRLRQRRRSAGLRPV